jgi:hypothetical protein
LVKDGPTMTITPFLTLILRGKKDALYARQKARRVANLLGYDPQEQACIAAGAFVVACQALALFGKARVCFQIENQHFEVFAQELKSESAKAALANRITGLFRAVEPKTLYRLSKPLPPEQSPHLDEMDLGWLVNKVEETAASGLFDEIVKQNQEMLTLLHELRLCQAALNRNEEKPRNPHAA